MVHIVPQGRWIKTVLKGKTVNEICYRALHSGLPKPQIYETEVLPLKLSHRKIGLAMQRKQHEQSQNKIWKGFFLVPFTVMFTRILRCFIVIRFIFHAK